MEYIQLKWDTWSDVCDFIDSSNFISGVYLDDLTSEITYEGCSNTVGLLMKRKNGEKLLIKQDEWIVKDNGEYYSTQDIEEYKRKVKLQKILNERIK